PEVTAIPISALVGDNVVEPSAHMDWYGGPTVLEHLESVPVSHDLAQAPVRFPVQYVIRQGETRHYAGQLAAGTLRVGDRVTVHPSGETSRIVAINLLGKEAPASFAPQSTAIRLADQRDISRGDMITTGVHAPVLTRDIRAVVCHLADRPLRVGDQVLLKHTTRTARAIVAEIPWRLTLNDLSRQPEPGLLTANDIGRVVVRTAEPLPLDSYADSRRTGSFILITPDDGTTLAAGMAQLRGEDLHVGYPSAP
ncbi:MAG: sulfate adenylyltransferase, partial [Streptomyces sp.]|nr:sulfate adenylyltransferase [Streptomyces sp.]